MVTSTGLGFHVNAATRQRLQGKVLFALLSSIVIVLELPNWQQCLIYVASRVLVKVQLLHVLHGR